MSQENVEGEPDPSYTCCMRPIRGGLLLAVGALALLIFPTAGWAAFPGANGRIAYQGSIPGTDIFTVLPDGSGTQQLTFDFTYDAGPSWSASGRRIVYNHRRHHVLTIDENGGNGRLVIRERGIVRSPHFSPSGNRIVYTRGRRGAVDARHPIFTVRTDGTHVRRVIAGRIAWPSYSPDGRRIAFAGIPHGKNGGGIWTVHPDGSHLHRLTRDTERRFAQMPDWAPDGRHIVFVRCNNDESARYTCVGAVDLMRADGSHRHPILRDWTGGYSAPAFSPNGHRIALTFSEFRSYPDHDFDPFPACTDIYTITLNGSGKRFVTHNCEDYRNGDPASWAAEPSWQPIPAD
jgi:Tol biopolymer transport system component